jgi:hypothetical protein
MGEKIPVRYEFYKYDADPLGVSKQYTLVLGNPANVRFIALSPVGTISQVIINNSYILNNYSQSVDPLLATAPFELNLNNNDFEIDKSNYSILIFGPDTTVHVICKYYVNEL